MKREREITQEAFDQLLGWLDADRDNAARKYETIRQRLIKIFTCRGCPEADDLADETINRVTSKVAQIRGNYSGEPALYFYGVAQKIHLEYLRQNRPRSTQPPPITVENDENEYECLETCLQKLPEDNRNLVIQYYQETKRAKIEHRRKLADGLGIAVNALRIRAHRIRMQLQKCVLQCLEQRPAN
jgi:RNA polymerase sigma factor (sigma-70 family)